MAVGPAAATDETTIPATLQAPTFQHTQPVVTSGNLVFTSFAVTADGMLTYEAVANTAGTAMFNIWVTDDGPTSHLLDDNTSDQQTITINVNPVADPPVPVTGDYVIDDGDDLVLDASSSFDPDTAFAGTVTEQLTYSWDIGGDGTFEVVNDTNSTVTITAATLAGLGLNVPGDNDVVLRVTDVFSGTPVSTTATLTINTVDYGDAPNANYGTLKASNGAAHTFVSGLHLGATIDTELDGQADDGADEDGIVFDPAMQADGTFALDSFFTATASAAGKLDIWIDFNNDGDFDPTEHLNEGTSYDLQQGANTIDFRINAGEAVTGVNTWARARFSSTGGLAATGRANDGEVEDYQIQISPLLPAEPVDHVLPMWSQTSDLTPLLQWDPNPGTPGANVLYNIELRNSQGQVVGFEENHPSTSISLSDPLPPGTYTAFVTAFNRAGQPGPVSQLNSFEVVALTVVSPTGTQGAGTPTIEWTPISQTDRYELQIQSSLTGAIIQTHNNIAGNTNSFTVTNELPIGGYRVRVRAIEDVTLQVGDWSPFQLFDVGTAPVITAPLGTIVDATPAVTWNAVSGAATYDVRISDITEDDIPLQTFTGLTTLSHNITSVLPLGEYTVEVRGVTAQNFAGNWTTPETFFVAIPTTITQPIGREPDSTPTVAWTAVNGADRYDVEIVNTVTSQIAYQANGILATQHTVPANQALPLGNYEVRVRANNIPAATSTGGTVSVLSTATAFMVSTPPEILTPGTGIYDTTPEFTWTEPFGAQTAEIEIVDFTTNQVVFSQTGISGTSFTIPNGTPLPPGGYTARIRSFGAGGVASDWSTVHVFQIGAAPVALGPSEGIGSAPHSRTDSARPTLTAQQSLAGVTFEFWLTDVSNSKTLFVARGLDSSSWTVPFDLDVGRYRYWVRATTDAGERSSWSQPYDFQVTTPPVISPIPPTFNRRPPIAWNDANSQNAQPEIDTYQVWINKIDVVPAQIILVEEGIVGTNFELPEDLANGRYKVWTRGFVTGTNATAGRTVSSWSVGQVFEVSGRPIVVPIGNTTDNTPLISWSSVEDAASYEIYLAQEGATSSPIVRLSGLTSSSYQVNQELLAGNYFFWVRATSNDGRVSPWSLTSQGRFSVDAATKPVVNSIPTSNNPQPTFSWSPTTGAARYEIYVAAVGSTSTAVISNNQITTTSYVSNVQLAPDDYRVWVRAISSAGSFGPWSTAVRFTITSNDTKTSDSPDVAEPKVMLASISAAESVMQQEDVTVSLVPAVVVEDAGRSLDVDQSNISFRDDQSAASKDARTEQAGPVDLETSDDLMAGWDEAIWNEESGEPVAAEAEIATSAVVDDKSVSKGWLAGLAMLAPSALRRRRKKE